MKPTATTSIPPQKTVYVNRMISIRADQDAYLRRESASVEGGASGLLRHLLDAYRAAKTAEVNPS